ncbi:MAG: hypothetical protein AB1427_08685 [Thermodesulfobacteriota bacterium]
MNDQEAIEIIREVANWMNSPRCEFSEDMPFDRKMNAVLEYLEGRLNGATETGGLVQHYVFKSGEIETVNIYNFEINIRGNHDKN